MNRAIGISLITHLLVIALFTVISLRSGTPYIETTVYTVSLMEFPTISSLKALDVTEKVRRTEPIKPLPPIDVEKIKPREKRVDVEEAKEVEVAKRTEPVVEEEVSEIGGIRVEGKEFEFPHYFEIIKRRLQSNFHNPYTTKGGKRLKATVYFQITDSGAVVNTTVEDPSGFSAFDRAAKRAVLASNPFPRLPEGYSGDILGVHCDFLSARE
jgi:TonB family protein